MKTYKPESRLTRKFKPSLVKIIGSKDYTLENFEERLYPKLKAKHISYEKTK